MTTNAEMCCFVNKVAEELLELFFILVWRTGNYLEREKTGKTGHQTSRLVQEGTGWRCIAVAG